MQNEKIVRDLLHELGLSHGVEISLSDDLEEYGFDSLASVGLITYLSQNSNVDIDPEELESLITMKDLDQFLSDKMNQ